MKRIIMDICALLSVLIVFPAEAYPVCQNIGCAQRAGYSVQVNYDMIDITKITNWNVNYQRFHIQTKVGDIVLYNDGRAVATNKNGETLYGSYHRDEYNNFVVYYDGWSRPVVIANPAQYGGY